MSSKIILLPHQKNIFKKYKRLKKKKKNGILIFHSIGTGKTISVLNILQKEVSKKSGVRIYIVLPLYLKSSWLFTIETNPEYFVLKDLIFFIDIKDPGKILSIPPNNWIVVDEAHNLVISYFRNPRYCIENTMKLFSVFQSSVFTIFMTATPIVDDLTDLFIYESICNNTKSNEELPFSHKHLYPKYYNSQNDFEILLYNKILPFLEIYTSTFPYYIIIGFLILLSDIYNGLNDISPSIFSRILVFSILSILNFLNYYNTHYKQYKILDYNYKSISKKIECIHTYIRPVIHKDFPTRKDVVVNFDLNYKQTKSIIESFVWDSEVYQRNYRYNTMKGLNKITRKSLLSFSNLNKSSKWRLLSEIISKHKDHIVISTRYNFKGLEILVSKLKKYKYEVISLKNLKEHLNIIDKFEKGEINILILSPEIVEGLTLKATKCIILLEVCYQNIIKEQIIGRVIRYNSHKSVKCKEVVVYEFVSQFDNSVFDQTLLEIVSMDENVYYFKNKKGILKYLSQYKTPDEYYFEKSLKIDNVYKHLIKYN